MTESEKPSLQWGFCDGLTSVSDLHQCKFNKLLPEGNLKIKVNMTEVETE